MHLSWRKALGPFLASCLLASAALAFNVPSLTAPVVDQAQLMTPSAKAKLDDALLALKNSGGSQIAVLIVPTLDGEPIERASIQVTDKWKLGTANADNGVLLFVAADDRALRIEVGQGLEGSLPDAYAKRIIEDVIIPGFRQQQFDAGIIAGVMAIARNTDPNFSFAPYFDASTATYRKSRQIGPIGSGRAIGTVVLLIILIIYTLLSKLMNFGGHRYRGRRSSYWGGGSGWGGGGGFGGGGFGGGGGGFSGGGASGRW